MERSASTKEVSFVEDVADLGFLRARISTEITEGCAKRVVRI